MCLFCSRPSISRLMRLQSDTEYSRLVLFGMWIIHKSLFLSRDLLNLAPLSAQVETIGDSYVAVTGKNAEFLMSFAI
jgi:hypothetical protein